MTMGGFLALSTRHDAFFSGADAIAVPACSDPIPAIAKSLQETANACLVRLRAVDKNAGRKSARAKSDQ